MSAIKVDVVMAHYNGSKYVAAQIASILNSELPDDVELGLSIVDDQSNAKDWDFLREECANFKNVRLSRNPTNRGVIKTFEAGLAQSNADYIFLADQDDVWLPQKIARSLDRLRKIEGDKPALVFTDLQPVDSELRPLKKSMLNIGSFQQSNDANALALRNIVSGCASAFNKRLKELALPFPAEIPMHDHWLAVCAAFGGRIDLLNEPLMLYRQHGANVVGQTDRRIITLARRPFTTWQRFGTTLRLKSQQMAMLAKRLPPSSAQVALKIATSLSKQSLRGIRELSEAGVIRLSHGADWLIAAMYLLRIN